MLPMVTNMIPLCQVNQNINWRRTDRGQLGYFWTWGTIASPLSGGNFPIDLESRLLFVGRRLIDIFHMYDVVKSSSVFDSKSYEPLLSAIPV